MRFLSTPTVLALAAVATLASACAEFMKESTEAADTLTDPNSTTAEARDEVGEAAKSVLPGEQKEGDIDVKLEALDDALQDLEIAVEKLQTDDPNKQRARDLRKMAQDLEAEAERVGAESSEAAKELLGRIDTAIADAEKAIDDLGDGA